MNRNEFFQALPLTRLTVRLTNATLEITSADIEDVHVMVAGDDHAVEALRIATAADTLTIEQPMTATAKAAAVSSSWMQIAVRIPRTWKGRIEGRTVTGWISLREVCGSDLTLDTVSGRITGTELDFITVGARSVIGDIRLNGLRCERCQMASTSGSLTAQQTTLNAGAASTVTGLVSFDLLAPFEELTLNTVTGDLCVDAPIDVCDAVLRSVNGRIRTTGVSIMEGGPKLRATTVSSDLDITRTGPTA